MGRYILWILLFFLTASCQAATYFSFMRGNNYALGDEYANTLRLDSADQWKYGDSFFFFDDTNPGQSNDSFYTEWQPRISFAKLTGKKLKAGPFSDLLIATEINQSSSGNQAILYGLGTNIVMPGFKVFKLNGYVRRNTTKPGQTYQISTAWLSIIPINTKFNVYFGGYTDYAGRQDTLAENFLAEARVLFDFSKYMGLRSGRVLMGLQYVYWHNKLGIQGVTESVPELLFSVRV